MINENRRKAMQTGHFGEHLTLDGYRGDFHQLNNQNVVEKCLNDLPGKLGMTKLADPQIYFAQGNQEYLFQSLPVRQNR